MLTQLLRTESSSVIHSLTLREIIDGCRGERTQEGEEEKRWVTRDGEDKVREEKPCVKRRAAG